MDRPADHFIELPISGGCACESVRYECDMAPLAMFNCHCRDCQYASGGSFVAVMLVHEPSLRLTRGAPKYYRSVGESGRWTDRGFCADCGSPLFAKGEVAPGYLSIKAGSLDEPDRFRPTIDTWAPHAPAWLQLDPGLPKAAKTPDVIRGRRSLRKG